MHAAHQILITTLFFYRYSDAINLLKRLLHNFLSDGRRGYWTLRLSVDLEHLGCPDESLRVAEDGLHDPWVRAGSRVALQRRVLRLGRPPRRWKIPNYSKSVNRKIPEVNAIIYFKCLVPIFLVIFVLELIQSSVILSEECDYICDGNIGSCSRETTEF